jgi:2-amino-4-hydroxy-6-hydroxymethyldihydropteridine diphosphokinase
MKKVYLGLGSNIERERHITAGLDALNCLLNGLKASRIYESKSIGFDGSNFYNLVVSGYTDLSVSVLTEQLKTIEDDNGRKRNGPKFSPRTLDIDILLYGNFIGSESGIILPRDEIIKNAFVLLPLAEIAPQEKHPVLNKTFEELWDAYDKNSQSLWPIDFHWDSKAIS